MPTRQPNPGAQPRVGEIASTPSSRNAVPAPSASQLATFSVKPPSERPPQGPLATFEGGNQGAGVPGDGSGGGLPSVGEPLGNSEVAGAQRVADLQAETQGAAASVVTPEEAAENAAAVEARRKGVLGCIGRNASGGGSVPQGGCGDPCETVDCLTELLTGNLLDLDAKKILCDTIRSSEKAAARQVANIGSSLLGAAQSLADAEVLQAPLKTLDAALGAVDPGAVAACFGAQDVIDSVRGQLRSVNNTIEDAESGAQDALAEKFNEGVEKAQQFAALPEDIC